MGGGAEGVTTLRSSWFRWFPPSFVGGNGAYCFEKRKKPRRKKMDKPKRGMGEEDRVHTEITDIFFDGALEEHPWSAQCSQESLTSHPGPGAKKRTQRAGCLCWRVMAIRPPSKMLEQLGQSLAPLALPGGLPGAWARAVHGGMCMGVCVCGGGVHGQSVRLHAAAAGSATRRACTSWRRRHCAVNGAAVLCARSIQPAVLCFCALNMCPMGPLRTPKAFAYSHL